MDKQGVVVIEAIVVEMESTDSVVVAMALAVVIFQVSGHHPPSSEKMALNKVYSDLAR